MKQVYVMLALGLLCRTAAAQESNDTTKVFIYEAETLTKDTAKGPTTLTIGAEGIQVVKTHTKKKRVEVKYLMFDLGFNMLHDRTDYASPAARQFLQVDESRRNENIFSLRQSKSINVNIWPVLANVYLWNGNNQKVSIYSGVGLQLYNFRFNKDISFLNETAPELVEDSIHFRKNKLAFAYASVPLMLQFKTRLSNTLWLDYAFGVIGGVCFDSWTKQISDERGKQKNHDQFNFQRFNLNLCGEIGISPGIRLYGTYQVSNLYDNSLNQHPYSLGIRFFGI